MEEENVYYRNRELFNSVKVAVKKWVLNLDGYDYAIGAIIDEIPWKADWDFVMRWDLEAHDVIDNAIGAREEFNIDEILSMNNEMWRLEHWAVERTEKILKAYYGLVDEVERRIENMTQKYKTYDIISSENGSCYIVMNSVDGKYETEKVGGTGETVTIPFYYAHHAYRKVGEVTKDVLQKLNPNIK